MLKIENLHVNVEDKKILQGLNLKISPGETHAIMGPNGSGKSTLANVLSGKNGYEVTGELNFKGENLKEIPIETFYRSESSSFHIKYSLNFLKHLTNYIFRNKRYL